MESLRGDESVLVVEDEESVRNFIDQALEAQGYKVIVARNGREAIRMLKESVQPIDLLVTDLIMPDMGGWELVRRIRKEGAQLPVLYISGYSTEDESSRELREEGEHFIPKPFGPSDLAKKIREVLDKSKKAVDV